MYGMRDVRGASAYEPSESTPLFSGSDAITLLEFVQQCLSCKNKNDFLTLYASLQNLVAFDYANAILGYRNGKNDIVSDFGVNVSMPREWIREYLAKNYLQEDTIVKENFTSFRVQFWSDTKKRIHYPGKINSLCYDFDMREGYTSGSKLPATGKYGSKFCFSSRSMRHDLRTVAMLNLVTPHLHLALFHLFSDRKPDHKGVILTSREKEVLNWLKQGKTSWDISAILNISERTVNFHVYNIMDKLGATNRPQAVAIATRLGLIDLN